MSLRVALWAQSKLSLFIELTDRVGHKQLPDVMRAGSKYRGSVVDIASQAAIVERILDDVLPRWLSVASAPMGPGQPG